MDDLLFSDVYYAPLSTAFEPNDSFATAATITEGTHTVTGSGEDWFVFEAFGGQMSASIAEAAGQQNLLVALYLGGTTGPGANLAFGGTADAFSYTLPSDGTYYLKVATAAYFSGTAPDGTALNYTLSLDLPEADVETNGTRATATSLEAGSLTVTDGVGEDWYVIRPGGPGDMGVTLTNTGSTAPNGNAINLNMEFYRGSSGDVSRAAFNTSSGGSGSFDFPSTGDDTYYLRVYGSPYSGGAPNGTSLDYRLDVTLPQGTWAVPLEFGPIRNASVAVYDIDNDGKDEIFVGTSKALDAQGNEVRPAGLIVLEDDGTVKWTKTFAPFAGPDPVTGKIYNTTSVSTQPIFSDVDGDGDIDIVVGVGADNRSEFNSASQPGDKGGLYALDAQGNELWFHATVDSFGGGSSGPDGRPDGVYGAPSVFDVDADGVREVIFTSWDHYLYILDGRTGAKERVVDLHDTAGATPAFADLNRDGLYEIVVPADITNNTAAGLPQQGGILHVLSNYGQPNVAGWNGQVGTSTDADFRGKFEEQSLWASPKIVDLDRDGVVEIVQGTGNFFQDGRGEYVKVWNADGSLRHTLATDGRVLASPLIADLTGDGTNEIIVATTNGHVHAFNAAGQQIFATSVQPYNAGGDQILPISRQPIAVDLDNANGDLEILVSIGSQIVVLDSDGTQITNTTRAERAFNSYAGAPVARDIDRDGVLEIISGGTTASMDQAVVYRWSNIAEVSASSYRTAAYQDSQSLHDIQAFVDRFYDIILGRDADAGGRNYWTDRLHTGVQSGADVAGGFIFSREFTSRGTSDAEYVNTLYSAFFNRAADAGGFQGWIDLLSSGASRADVLEGFTGSREFSNLSNSFGIRPESRYGASSTAALITGDVGADATVLRGSAGAQTLHDSATLAASGSETVTAGQIYRLYGATLAREPDVGGFLSWYNGISNGQITVQQAAGGFADSREFLNEYGALTNADFVELLYRNVLGRASDAGGRATWLGLLDGGTSRADVVLGFSDSGEYQRNTNAGLDAFMRDVEPKWNDVLEGGSGNDQMNGGIGADVFVFRQGEGGIDTIHRFEPWDELQLSGFGYAAAADAIARMSQDGGDVLFVDQGQAIRFLDTTLADMGRVRYNLS